MGLTMEWFALFRLQETGNTVGAYQVALSFWTRLELCMLAFLVALAMRLLLYTNDIRMSKTHANEVHRD